MRRVLAALLALVPLPVAAADPCFEIILVQDMPVLMVNRCTGQAWRYGMDVDLDAAGKPVLNADGTAKIHDLWIALPAVPISVTPMRRQ